MTEEENQSLDALVNIFAKYTSAFLYNISEESKEISQIVKEISREKAEGNADTPETMGIVFDEQIIHLNREMFAAVMALLSIADIISDALTIALSNS